MAPIHNGVDQILSAWMRLMPVVKLEGLVNHPQVPCRLDQSFPCKLLGCLSERVSGLKE